MSTPTIRPQSECGSPYMTRREAADYLRISVASIDRRLTPAKDGARQGKFRFVTMDGCDLGSRPPIRILASDVYAVLPKPEESAA